MRQGMSMTIQEILDEINRLLSLYQKKKVDELPKQKPPKS
jgi:hypothetical protein